MNRIIYTVKAGDNLYQIAEWFGVDVDTIKTANLLTSDEIFPGQQIFIPVQFYIVRPGDTLYDIARRFDTTVASIVQLNNLTSPMLMIGQKLAIPIYSEAIVTSDKANIYKSATINSPILEQVVQGTRLPVIGEYRQWFKIRLYNDEVGYVDKNNVEFKVHDGSIPITNILGFYTLEEGPALPSSYESFVNNTDVLSSLGLFMYRLDEENPTEIEKFGEFTDEEVDELVAIAHRNNVKIMPVVHNLLYKRGDTTVSKNVVSEMLKSKESREEFINNIIRLIERHNFDGVNIDIEDVYKEDEYNLSLFFTELGDALDQKGYFLSGSIPSRVSDRPYNPFSDPFNYTVIGEAVDEFVAMLYNEHGWPGSGPGPVVSIGWMERVLRYAMTKMPKEKIMGAVSVFGFDFNLDTGKNTYVTYKQAIETAEKYGAEIMFDEESQTPMFSYVDENGEKHEVWYEDAQSILAKVQLAWNLGVKGLALWRLGLEDPEIWTVLRNDAVVSK